MSIILTSIVVSYLISDIYENILGFILILSISVIHGANDLLIIKKYSTPCLILQIKSIEKLMVEFIMMKDK